MISLEARLTLQAQKERRLGRGALGEIIICKKARNTRAVFLRHTKQITQQDHSSLFYELQLEENNWSWS